MWEETYPKCSIHTSTYLRHPLGEEGRETGRCTQSLEARVACDKQREAAAKGWTVRETTAAPERVAVGKAITKGLFTVGTGLLKGRPRKGGKVTVTYERTLPTHSESDA